MTIGLLLKIYIVGFIITMIISLVYVKWYKQPIKDVTDRDNYYELEYERQRRDKDKEDTALIITFFSFLWIISVPVSLLLLIVTLTKELILKLL